MGPCQITLTSCYNGLLFRDILLMMQCTVGHTLPSHNQCSHQSVIACIVCTCSLYHQFSWFFYNLMYLHCGLTYCLSKSMMTMMMIIVVTQKFTNNHYVCVSKCWRRRQWGVNAAYLTTHFNTSRFLSLSTVRVTELN